MTNKMHESPKWKVETWLNLRTMCMWGSNGSRICTKTSINLAPLLYHLLQRKMWILRPFRLTTEKGDSCGMNLDNPISWWTYLQVILHPLPSHPTPQTQQKENGTKKKEATKSQRIDEGTGVSDNEVQKGNLCFYLSKTHDHNQDRNWFQSFLFNSYRPLH